MILELAQRIPSQSLPQGSEPTQFNGLFFHDCMRDERAVTTSKQFLLETKPSNNVAHNFKLYKL